MQTSAQLERTLFQGDKLQSAAHKADDITSFMAINITRHLTTHSAACATSATGARSPLKTTDAWGPPRVVGVIWWVGVQLAGFVTHSGSHTSAAFLLYREKLWLSRCLKPCYMFHMSVPRPQAIRSCVCRPTYISPPLHLVDGGPESDWCGARTVIKVHAGEVICPQREISMCKICSSDIY